MYECSISTSTVFTKVCMIKFLFTFKVQAYFYTLLTFQNLDKICKKFYFAINNNNQGFCEFDKSIFYRNFFLVAEKSQGDAIKLFRSQTKMYPINYHSLGVSKQAGKVGIKKNIVTSFGNMLKHKHFVQDLFDFRTEHQKLVVFSFSIQKTIYVLDSSALMSFEKLSSFNQTYITFTYMSSRREWRCYSKICLLAQFVLTPSTG